MGSIDPDGIQRGSTTTQRSNSASSAQMIRFRQNPLELSWAGGVVDGGVIDPRSHQPEPLH
ncbi:hypothetical protein SynA18461_01124 [Synechococcus sp. A18-46.1]|nr:hypothetical protein SynA18461_01124 [Synechococcus sp. A18-46.1]